MRKTVISLFVLMIYSMNPIYSQWTNVKTTFTSDISTVITHGSSIISACLGKGVYKSSDNGKSWVQINKGLTSLEVTTLLSTGTKLFAGTKFNGLFEFDGSTWNAVQICYCDQTAIHALGFCGSVLYAAVNSSIYNSTDLGVTWIKVKDLTKSNYVTTFAFNCCTVFAGTDGAGVLYSINQGATWKDFSGSVNSFINVLISYKNNLYAGTAAGVYWTSATDTTSSWQKIGSYSSSVTSLMFVNDNFYLGSESAGIGMYNGTQWMGVLNQFSDKSISSMLNTGTYQFVATLQFGIFSSNDNASTWNQTAAGIFDNLKQITADDNQVVALTGSQNGLFRTTDAGTSWVNISPKYSTFPIWNFLQESGGKIYIGGVNGFFQSSASSINWYYGGISSTAKSLIVDSNIIYVSEIDDNGYSLMLTSSDNGLTWQTSNLRIKGFIRSFFRSASLNALLAAHSSVGMLINVNNGNVWDTINNGLTDPQNTSFFKLGEIYPFIYAASSKAVYSLDVTNIPLQWMPIKDFSIDLGSDAVISDILFVGRNIIVSVLGHGIFTSKDLGVTWNSQNTGLKDINIVSLASNSSKVFGASQMGSLWSRPIADVFSSITSVDNKNDNLPVKYILDQNYPNPFNPATTIKYTIPTETPYMTSLQLVTLKVYDLFGREVSTLVNDHKPGGNYEIKFNAANLSSGVYFYKLTAGSYSITKKMMLIK